MIFIIRDGEGRNQAFEYDMAGLRLEQGDLVEVQTIVGWKCCEGGPTKTMVHAWATKAATGRREQITLTPVVEE